jgi:hypothetical protein
MNLRFNIVYITLNPYRFVHAGLGWSMYLSPINLDYLETKV